LRALELRVPPVAQFLLAGGLMALARWLAPGAAFSVPGQLLAASIVLLAAGLVGLAGVRAFARAGTTVNPLVPERASELVSGGIYRYTRNPMYLALLLALLAFGLWLGSWPALVLLPAFVASMNRLQIGPEERALERLFGGEYAAYRRRVRRWL
jgi:protein-S-isoprenylcysteine O-methyltransferase Ste14